MPVFAARRRLVAAFPVMLVTTLALTLSSATSADAQTPRERKVAHGGIYHVGIFLGREDGHAYILHSPRTGSVVHKQRVWTTQWRAGTLR